MLPVFIGIGLGVLLGSIPLFIPGFPAALKLGLAGGPLIMALILGRIGSIGKLYWFMPPSANLALRELGIVLFLAVVGLKSGGDFVATLIDGDGMSWIVYGIFITAIPLLAVGILARMLAKMNYLTLCGMLVRFNDRPARAGLCQQPACHQRRGGALLRDRLSAGHVLTYYHAAATGGAVLGDRLTDSPPGRAAGGSPPDTRWRYGTSLNS